MALSDDMAELLSLFEKHEVEYVLVGGYAVNYYGYIRSTQDIDLLVNPSIENAEKLMIALDDFGFGEAGIPRSYFEKPGSAIHLGNEPNRIDLLTKLKGISNDQIFANKKRVQFDSIAVDIIDYQDLIQAKRLSDRLRDQADADELEKTDRHSSE